MAWARSKWPAGARKARQRPLAARNWKHSLRVCSLISRAFARPAGMRIPRFVAVFAASVILLSGLCFAQKSETLASNPAILPQAFVGWQISQPARTSADPALADPVNAALLKE